MSWEAAYVGRPFGVGPGEVTCWSLVRDVYRDRRGVTLPEYGEIDARDLVRIAAAMEAGADDGWAPVDPPRELDVVLMRGWRGRGVVHVGVMVDDRRLLHVEEASATVVVPLTHRSVARRIVGFRRLAQ